MATKIDAHNLVSLAALARLIPGRVTQKTVRVWCEQGRRNRSTGKVVFLRRVQMPYGWASSMDHYYQFLEELNEASDGD